MKQLKKTYSRLVAFMVAFVMIFTMMPLSAFAEETEAYLSEVAFRNKMSNGTDYTILPEFDKDTYAYTLVIDDYANPASGLFIFPSSSDNSKINVSRTHIVNGKTLSVNVSSGGKASLMQSFKANSGAGGNVITATVGTKSYTFSIVRKMSLKSLAISDESGEIPYEVSFDRDTTTYLITVPADTDKVKITATPTASGSDVTINGGSETTIDVNFENHAMTFPVVVSNSATEGNVATTYNLILQEQPTSFAVTTPPTKTTYQIGEKFDPAGMVVSAVYEDGSPASALKESDYTITVSGILTDKDTHAIITYAGMEVQIPITVESPFDGKGTESEPYQLIDVNDLCVLQELVAKGITFEGYHFEITEHIVLPKDWTGLGTLKEGATGGAEGENILPFSGSIDGKNHTVIVPENGMPLFSYVRKATVKNLNIYGEKIASHGLVANYSIDYGSDGDYGEGDEGGSYINGTPDTIDIINVTLKSGTKTLKSGFIGGFASGANTVNIINCTIEEGVVIGYDKDQSTIGSFGGMFNGTITNSVSYATVYGVDVVGGLIGNKGQSMGLCNVKNSEFHGKVEATGNYAGGIIGAGYSGGGSAPNTMCVTIQNCLVTGSISGKNNVGGILGGEPGAESCWDNGIGYIQDNLFVGKVSGIDGNVGGIIGYMNSLNRHNIIKNNYFANTCGTEKGIGAVNEKFVDLNSEKFGRDDDPLGKDADKLTKAVTTEELKNFSVVTLLNNSDSSYKNWMQGTDYPVHSSEKVAYKLEISGEYKATYKVGEELDLTGMTFTAKWTDGTTTTLTAADVTISGYDKNIRGQQTVTIRYGAVLESILITVLMPDGNIDVTFSILGDNKHDSETDGNIHTLADENLITWVAPQTYTVESNMTVKELLDMVLKANNMTCSNPTGNYVESITRNGVVLGEFTNGSNSGWMFTINGVHGQLGVEQQYMNTGDVIVFHYTDDHTKESKIGGTAKTPKDVMELINAIGVVTLESGTTITAARQAYDVLSEEDKELVTNYEVLTAAETKLEELKEELKENLVEIETIYKNTGAHLNKLADEYDVTFASIGGEWMVLGLVRSGYEVPEEYYDNIVTYVKENIDENGRLHRSKSTDNSRLILALTAAGYDVTNVGGYDLLQGLSDLSYVKKQGVNGPIWALIALDSHDYAIPANKEKESQTTRENLIATIIDMQLSDGGWALNGDVADSDMTGMAIQALASYYKTNEKVKAALDKAITCLSEMQNEDGGYSTTTDVTYGTVPTSESVAQVIVALTALGINPDTDGRFVKNGNSVLDALGMYYVEGGGFSHLLGGELDGMATEQGYYALVSYVRMLNGQASLYDMSDVTIESNNTEQPDEGEQPGTTEKPDTTDREEEKDDSNKSPETGDMTPILPVAAIAMISLMTGAIILKKKKENF